MKEKFYKNKYGKIPSGTKVAFTMENADMWGGDTTGILTYNYNNDSWTINTKHSGEIKIGGYLEAYPNTIYPI